MILITLEDGAGTSAFSFAGFFRPDTFFNRPRVRAMRNAGRMKGKHPAGYVFPAHKIAVNIIQQLITVNVTVIIRSRNSKWMIVV